MLIMMTSDELLELDRKNSYPFKTMVVDMLMANDDNC